MCSLYCFEVSLLFVSIGVTKLSIGEITTCIPKEYRGVRRETWTGLNGGWFLTHLTTNPRYPNYPTNVEILPTFTPPKDYGEFYGQRLQAYFVPPVSGNYSFYATCDSECAFYLSSDETHENKKEVIRIDQLHRTKYEQWDRFPEQISCFQQLEQGKLYYIEAIHSNYRRSDHVRIHVKFPGSNSTRPLDREFLFLYSPDSFEQTTCILLKRCGVTCGGGLETRITTKPDQSQECVRHESSVYKEDPSVQVQVNNISETSAVVAWKPLERSSASVVDFSGYKVSLKSDREISRERLVNMSIDSMSFNSLKIFTNYCATVEPQTAFGSLWKEECLYFITEDSTPDSPPQDITAVNTDKNSILVRWKSIPEQDRNGIILGFKLTHMKISATLHMKKPVDEEAKLWPRFETIIDGDTYVTVLSSKVKPFAWYCIKMLGFTRKGEGRESSCVFLRTKESVPSRAPINITTAPLNSTAFSVSWQPVPLDHENGIVLGYKVLLSRLNTDFILLLEEAVDVNQTQIVLEISPEMPSVCVKVLAFTKKGNGRKSSCIEGWTWSEETLFPDMQANNNSSPTGFTITWNKPRDEVLSQLIYYHVTYEAVVLVNQPVNSSQVFLNVSADSLEVSVRDLETYTTYKVTVEAITRDGESKKKKVIFTKTCRCPHLMYANWAPSPPYVVEDRSSGEPRGLIPELLAHMLQASCGTCCSYKVWNISFAINTTEKITEPDSRVKVDFRFPIRSAVGRTTYRGTHSYVPLITVPGVALMTKKKTPSGYARDLGNSVLRSSSIFAINIALAISMGIIIWFAESVRNDKHFTHHFHRGVVEGVWWSFITMTTVGYGDRYPKTILGRSIAIVWFLTGIVLSSLLVSSLTSSMSVRILDQNFNVAKGKKVGALAQFPEYDLIIRFISKAGESKTFLTLEKLVDALEDEEVDGILVDLYTASYRSDLFNVTWIVINQIIPFEFTSGVVISRSAVRLKEHFRDYIETKGTVAVTEVLKKRTSEEEKENKTSIYKNEMNHIPLLDPRTPIYQVTIFILLALLFLAVFMGLVNHSWYKGLQKRRYRKQAKRERQREEYITAKLQLQQLVEEFYQRFSLRYRELRLKHRKQLECFKMANAASTNGKMQLNVPNGHWV